MSTRYSRSCMTISNAINSLTDSLVSLDEDIRRTLPRCRRSLTKLFRRDYDGDRSTGVCFDKATALSRRCLSVVGCCSSLHRYRPGKCCQIPSPLRCLQSLYPLKNKKRRIELMNFSSSPFFHYGRSRDQRKYLRT